MTFRISIDALQALGPEAFAAAVDSHIAILREYDAHEAVVRRHAADPDMKPEDRWATLAVPKAAPEVEAAIKRTPQSDGSVEFVADYEIVGPTLEQKKAKLFDRVSEAERDAIKAVAPAGKIRAYQFREADIRKADQTRYTTYIAMVTEPIDFAKYSSAQRPHDDTFFLNEQSAREGRRDAIYRWAANLHSDIEDLTEATVDSFEVKPFHA